MGDTGWQPGRWWRVEGPDGVWAETSNETEARSAMRPGDVLFREWRREQIEYREVE